MGGVHKTRSLYVATDKCGPARANNDDLLRQMAALIKKKKYIKSQQSTCKDRSLKYNRKNIGKNYTYTGSWTA